MISVLVCLAATFSFQVPAGSDLLGGRAFELTQNPELMEGSASTNSARVFVKQKREQAWDVQLRTPRFARAVRKGEVVLIGYRARALRTFNESASAQWIVYGQLSRAPWTGLGGSSGSAGKNWRQFHHAFVSPQDFEPETLEITFHLAAQKQEVEFTDFAVSLYPVGTELAKLPRTQLTWNGREANAPWRKQAEAMIDKNRKGDLNIVVRRNGKPVRNAAVQVRMMEHAYPFGTFSETHVGKETADSKRYVSIMSDRRRFSRLTVPIYWADWGWESENTRREYLQAIEYCVAMGIRMKAHNLLWPSYKWSPTRLAGMPNDQLRAEILKAMDARIADLKKFKFENMDVLNELRTETEFADKLGFELYPLTFRKARLGWPNADLVYNDYAIFEGAQGGGAAADVSERIAQQLKSARAPVTMLGWQAHFGEDLTPPVVVWQMLDRFKKSVGLPIEATEFDIETRDEQAQADYTRDLLTAWFAHPNTAGFTMWGFYEGSHWKPLGAMYRKDWSPKPNAKVWDDLVMRKWWTNAVLRTAPNGRAKTRGFLGDYEIVVGGKTVKAVLGKPATTVVIDL